MKRISRLAALLLAIALVLSACTGGTDTASPSATDPGSTPEQSSGSEAATPKKDAVVIAMSATWDTLMPYNSTANYGSIIYGQVYDKLVYHNGDYTVSPRLAQSWEVSEDHTSMTFHLSKDAKWHDGQPVTAQDCVFTFELLANAEIQSTKRPLFSALVGLDASGILIEGETLGVSAPDDHTLQLTFKDPCDPDAILNMFMRQFYVLPKHVLEDKTPAELNNGDFWAQNPIGSGPYKYDSQITGERITFTANEDYYLGAPKIPTLIIRVVPSTNMLAGLMSGEIDILAGGALGSVPLEDWEMAQQQENLETSTHAGFGYQYMTLNMQKTYLTQEVRQAICMAIDREKLVTGLMMGEGAVLTSGGFTPSHPYYQGEIKQEFNPEKAKQMLADAGWDESRELELLVPTGNAIRERSAVLIQQDLAAVGVKVNITTADFATVMATMQKADGCDLGLIGAAGNIDPDEGANQSNPNGSSNFANFPKDETRIYDLYMQGRTGTSFDERKPIYDQIQALNVEIGCRLYLYSPHILMAYNKDLTGMDVRSFDNVNWDTWKWEYK